jgi:hypothetical protein
MLDGESMRKTVLVVLLNFVSVSSSFPLLSQTSKSQGFTLTFMREMMNTKRGKPPLPNGFVIAVRANGEESTTETWDGITDCSHVVTATKSYTFSPELALVSTLSGGDVTRPKDATCETHIGLPDDKVIGHGTFYGLPVVKWSSKSGIGDYMIVEFWEAPALGCRTVYSNTIFYSADGSIKAETNEILTDLKWGEPDPKLFDMAGFKEVRPSELRAKFAELHGLTPPPNSPAFLEADQRYLRSKYSKTK